MREIVFGLAAVLGVGGVVYMSPGAGEIVYPMTADKAVSKVSSADRRVGKQPFGSMNVYVTRPADNIIKFNTDSNHATLSCTAEFPEAGEGRVYAKTSCDVPLGVIDPKLGRTGISGAEKTINQMTDVAFREFVHSALEGRPFNDRLIAASNASAVLKNMPEMRRDALEIKEKVEAMERDMKSGHSSSDWGADTPPPEGW